MALIPEESECDVKILFITVFIPAMTNQLDLTKKLKYLFKPLSRMQNIGASYNPPPTMLTNKGKMHASISQIYKDTRAVRKQKGMDKLSPEMEYLFLGKMRLAVISFIRSICQICDLKI